jgi:hypothetical protein
VDINTTFNAYWCACVFNRVYSMPTKTRVNGKIVGIKFFTSSSRKTETEVSILTLLQNAHGNIGRREKFSNNQT